MFIDGHDFQMLELLEERSVDLADLRAFNLAPLKELVLICP